MRRGGRVRCSIYARFLFFCAGIANASCIKYGVPIEIEYWDTGRSPLSHMVDVTNGFGLKVLAEHNFLNDNNIAFSPYGLMGIMVALYEGVQGDSSYQIQRAMQLPWSRNVMRIGFRDIHRTLKTYFVPEEGFLAGLALNNENVTFNDDYKKVLRFYGFDVESEQTTTTSPDLFNSTSAATANTLETKIPTTSNIENVSTVANEDSTTNPSMTANVMAESTTAPPSTISSTNEPTTTNPSVTTDVVQESTWTPSSTITPTDGPSSTNPSVTTDVMQESTTTPTFTITSTNEPSTTNPSVTTNIMQESTISPSSTISSTNGPSNSETTFPLNNLLESTATTTAVPVESTMASSTVLVTSTTSEPLLTTITTTLNTDVEILTDITSFTTDQTVPATSTMTTEPSTITTPGSEDTTVMTTAIGTTESTSTTPLSTESLSSVDTTTLTPTSENTTASTESSTLNTNTTDDTESVPNQVLPIISESNLETLTRRKKSLVDFIFTNPPYFDDYALFRSYDIGPELPSTGYEFSVNGLKNIQVTYMNYDTVLEHAYLPHLEASALKLPLDSDRYYLLVVLPNRRRVGELERLLARMARESDLSDVCAALRPRRVRAFVPGFMVKGHVTLTTDLQKIGIREVFEPRQSDFAPMTCQVGVYVRSIEQAVSVAIRKYQPDAKMNRYVSNRRRVYFSATYPFLYFVMDSSIHVALMAGKMVDPLNTRIL